MGIGVALLLWGVVEMLTGTRQTSIPVAVGGDTMATARQLGVPRWVLYLILGVAALIISLGVFLLVAY